MSKNTIYIDAIIDDKGTMKKVALDAGQLSKNLDKHNKSAATADRVMKGASKQSANTTKNFSKMSQGISGGLVPAYATLAAQLFAISAAFRFLQESGDLKALQAGQVAYASATGVAMRSLTQDIQAATDAQLGFREASQAASIGIASGLSPDQLTRLGGAAKDASLILGRDLTDSFNRLIRGVTKGEPELLDELGIILRLKDATEDYSRAINKNVNDLTAQERSQAVFNDVITQAEEKYGKVMDIVNPSVNQFNQLGKAFDDIVLKIREVAAAVAGPLAKVLIDTPSVAFAGFALLSKGIINTAIPAIGQMSENMKNFATVTQESVAEARKAIVQEKENLRAGFIDRKFVKEFKKSSVVDLKEVFKGSGITGKGNSDVGKIINSEFKNISNNVVDNVKNMVRNGTDEFANLTTASRKTALQALDDIQEANNTTMTKAGLATKSYTNSGIIAFKTLGAQGRAAMAGIASGVSKVTVALGRLINIAGILGIAFTALSIAKDFIFPAKQMSDTEKAAERLGEKLSSVNEDFDKFVAVQKELTKEGSGTLNFMASLSRMSGSLNVKEFTSSLQQAQKVVLNVRANIDGMFDRQMSKTRAMAAEAETLIGQLINSVKPTFTDEDIAGITQTRSLSEAIKNSDKFSEAQKNTIIFIERQIEAFDNLSEAQKNGSQSQRAYIEGLRAFMKDGSISNEELIRRREAFQAIGKTVTSLNRALEEGRKIATDSFKKFLPETEYDRVVDTLNKAIEKQKILIKDAGSFSNFINSEYGGDAEAFIKQQNSLKAQINFAKELNELEKERELRQNRLSTAMSRMSIGATSGQMSRIEEANEIVQKELELLKIREDNRSIETALDSLGLEARARKKRELDLNRSRTLELQAQLDLLKAQADQMYQLSQAGRNAFESATSEGLADLIKNNEGSLRDTMLKIAESTLGAVADTLSKQVTDGLMDKLFGKKNAAQEMRSAIKDGADYHIQGLREVMGGGKRVNKKTIEEIKSGDSSGIGELVKNTSLLYGKGNSKEGSGGSTGIFGPFVDSLKNLFGDENTPFLKGLGSVLSNGLRGFGDLFKQLGSGLMNMLSGGGSGGGILASVASMFFAEGGMASGGFRAFANGGMVNKPTVGLVGEGRHNEAIVPLPNGKAIPVDMKGSSGDTSVVVNVSVDNNGNASQSVGKTEGQSADLGNAIASAVKRELQNQKRSGGMLNRYGAA